jgi:succinate-acetate transporter protein
MAVGNTFGATALSSYGGFWIAYGILNTPHWQLTSPTGPYHTEATKAIDPLMFDSAMGFFLTGWFIFNTILLLCTLRSTVMFFLLFFTLDLAFLTLACGHFAANDGHPEAAIKLTQAGGGFGILSAFLAWYNAFAGIADSRYVLLFSPFSPVPCFLRLGRHFTVIMDVIGPKDSITLPGLAPGIGSMSQDVPSRHATFVTPKTFAQPFAQFEPHEKTRWHWLTRFSSQQLFLPHPRLPLPVVGEGPRGSPCQAGHQRVSCVDDGTGCNTKRACVLGLAILFTIFIFQRLSCGLRVLFVCRVGYSEPPMPSIQYHSHVVNALDHSGVGWWGGLRLWETGSQGSGAERCERYPPCCGINFITSSNKSAKQDEAAVSPTLWIANFETWSSGPQAVMGFPPHIPTHQQRLTW